MTICKELVYYTNCCIIKCVLGELKLLQNRLRYENMYNINQKIDTNTTYPKTYTPVLKPVKKKIKTKSHYNTLTVAFVIFMTTFISAFVLPFSYKYFISPIFKNPSECPFRVNYEQIYSPTSKYLHNNLFLGVHSLKGAETDTPLMSSLNLTAEMTVLEASLKNLANEYKTIHPSIFVWDYETGKYASLNSKERFPAASIIKIPVLLQLFRSVEAGQISIEDKMVLTDYYRAEGSGDIQFQRTGNEYSMDFLARKMIEISDNSSTNMIMSSIGGMNDVNRAIKSWGLKDTEVNNWLPDMSGTNVTTAEDLARMLYNIDNDEFLSSLSKDKIFDYMGHVKNNRLIHAGLNPNAKFYHKTGDIGHTMGDTGIVVMPDGHKYIVSILVKRPYNSHAGKEFTVRASEIIYNTMASRALK